jgi:hypothetical protein
MGLAATSVRRKVLRGRPAPHEEERDDQSFFYTTSSSFYTSSLCVSFVTSKLPGGVEKKDTQSPLTHLDNKKLLYKKKLNFFTFFFVFEAQQQTRPDKRFFLPCFWKETVT